MMRLKLSLIFYFFFFFQIFNSIVNEIMSIKALVLDAGPLLTQSHSDIAPLAGSFFTTPAVHAEIRDERARQNLMLWGDKLTVRQPKPEFMTIVTEFSKKTGDYSVLSSTDLSILALCYELECELNNGDWRLRKYPGEIKKPKETKTDTKDTEAQAEGTESEPIEESKETKNDNAPETVEKSVNDTASNLEKLSVTDKDTNKENVEEQEEQASEPAAEEEDEWTVVKTKAKPKPKKKKKNNAFSPAPVFVAKPAPEPEAENAGEDDDSDEEEGEWITAENLQETLNKGPGDLAEKAPTKLIKAAMSTGDFAMQNVALQIGLNLVNPTNGRYIRQVKNYMLRCHACFKLCPLPKTEKPLQFCPRCGGDTLMRCSVSVSDNGKLQVHLKKNMQWSHRGNRYSLPNPQSKAARRTQRPEESILLREDQKEYQKAVKDDMWRKRQNEKMLDEWIGTGSADNVGSPFAISGYKRDPTRHSGVRVGRGRYVNSAKKKR
uniref:20S-pre-rRNA D-site endonuclease NOB1 n=1 Tax=Blastobotrys adeninivorans TaxID=409370 RepID=A0A060SX67_BLAAD